MMSMHGPSNLSNAWTSITVKGIQEKKENTTFIIIYYNTLNSSSSIFLYFEYCLKAVVLPKHLTFSTAYAEAALGLFVTRANSPKYCPLVHVAMSTSSSSVSVFNCEQTSQWQFFIKKKKSLTFCNLPYRFIVNFTEILGQLYSPINLL